MEKTAINIEALTSQALTIAEKMGLGPVAREALATWNLAEGEVVKLPLATFSRLEASTHASQVIAGLNELHQAVFPNPIGWKTAAGALIGAALAGGASFEVEQSSRNVSQSGSNNRSETVGAIRLHGLLNLLQDRLDVQRRPRLNFVAGAAFGASLANRFE